MSYNIIVADSRDIHRIGWRTIFTNYECIANIYEAVSKEHLDQLLQMHPIDLIFVHQSLVTNLAALPPKRFVLLTTKFDIYTFQAAHKYGARGYLLEDASVESLLAALTLPEDTFLTEPRIVSEVITYLSHDSRYDVQDRLLTSREKEILCLLRSGIKRDDISKKLNISKSTLKTHIGNINKKRNILQI